VGGCKDRGKDMTVSGSPKRSAHYNHKLVIQNFLHALFSWLCAMGKLQGHSGCCTIRNVWPWRFVFFAFHHFVHVKLCCTPLYIRPTALTSPRFMIGLSLRSCILGNKPEGTAQRIHSYLCLPLSVSMHIKDMLLKWVPT
jgi:hypothetical protein